MFWVLYIHILNSFDFTLIFIYYTFYFYHVTLC